MFSTIFLCYLALSVIVTVALSILPDLGDVNEKAPSLWGRFMVFATFPFVVLIAGLLGDKGFLHGIIGHSWLGIRIIFHPLFGDPDEEDGF